MFEPISLDPGFGSRFGADVFLRGLQTLPSEDATDLRAFLSKFGVARAHACVLLPPNGPDEAGFQEVVCVEQQTIVRADAVIWNDDRTVVTVSRDCPTALFRYRDQWAAAHIGRYALWHHPENHCSSCSKSVLGNVLEELGAINRSEVYVYLLGGICGWHFRHEQDDAERYIRHYDFLKRPEVFLDRKLGQLDLYRAARVLLEKSGVPSDNIRQLDVCTYEHTSLSSKRGFDAGHAHKAGYNYVGIKPHRT